MGAGERVPVGRKNVLGGGGGRATRGAAVGARERVPVGRKNVLGGVGGRAPRAVELGDRKRLPSTLIRERARRLDECAKTDNAEREKTFQRNMLHNSSTR